MRTPEQIENLRIVLFSQFGNVALFMSEAFINGYADKLQGSIDEIKYHWIVKIQTKENVMKDWEEIEPEESDPFYSLQEISKKCFGLLDQHPQILQIMIADSETCTAIQYFTRVSEIQK